jgi:hypothetical protein
VPPEKLKPHEWFEPIEPEAQPTTPAAPTPPSGPSVKVIRLLPLAQQTDPLARYINCTSSEDDWGKKRDLSPFYLGPCKLYGGHTSRTMENAWQYSKVFAEHVGDDGLPTAAYFEWAEEGWNRPRAERYPMGKGAKAEFHWWNGKKLTKVEARKEIYVPLYAEQVTKPTNRTFDGLEKLWLLMRGRNKGTLCLMDFDAYDYTGMSLTDVLNNPAKSLGHGFVLAMLLLKDPALKQCPLRTARR